MRAEAYRLMEELDGTYWWYRARRGILCDVVRRFVRPCGDVIDYGSGSGWTALGLREIGFRVQAADCSARALEVCRSRGLPTVDLKLQGLPSAAADCILVCDVLEHVDDDVGLLERLRDLLRPGGRLIATVPAYEFLWSGEDYASEHVRRYTGRLIRHRLNSAGYEVVWDSYFNTLLFPAIAAAIVGKRLFRPRDMYRSNVRPLPAWQNGLLARLFAVERPLLRRIRLPFGVSFLAVAQPSQAP
jgi:SAM-dependent methyltransferase